MLHNCSHESICISQRFGNFSRNRQPNPALAPARQPDAAAIGADVGRVAVSHSQARSFWAGEHPAAGARCTGIASGGAARSPVRAARAFHSRGRAAGAGCTPATRPPTAQWQCRQLGAPVKKLNVFYSGWGEHWHLGTLLDTGSELLFEYTPAAIARGLQLSPLHHPLPQAGAGTTTFRSERSFYSLPGFIADSLPDGWGMLLMDRALRRAGRDPAAVSVLERLAIVGDRAIGALSFEPAQEGTTPQVELTLKDIALRIAELQQDKARSEKGAPDGLQQLLRLGGSPQGARPKVLVNFNVRTGVVSTGSNSDDVPTGAATPWLIKFPAEREHKEVCAMEELYARVARAAGHDMPKSRLFDLGTKYSAFGVERFDRVVAKGKVGNKSLLRVPVMSLSAMLQADHRLPSLDYETVLLATLRITGSQPELLKAFERCVLNVLLHNRDDHSKNFAFRLNEQGYWKLSPVFDLTFSNGPGGEHSTSVLGHGKEITRAHLMALAKRCGVAHGAAESAITRTTKATQALPRLAKNLPIRAASLKRLAQTVSEQLQNM